MKLQKENTKASINEVVKDYKTVVINEKLKLKSVEVQPVIDHSIATALEHSDEVKDKVEEIKSESEKTIKSLEETLKIGSEETAVEPIIDHSIATALDQHGEVEKKVEEIKKDSEKTIKEISESTKVKNRRELAKLIETANKDNTKFKITRSVEEGYRYNFITTKTLNESDEIGSKTYPYLVMETSREVYQAQFIEHSLTVKELKEILEGFEDDLPVITSHDRGYTYGSIREENFRATFFNDDAEEVDVKGNKVNHLYEDISALQKSLGKKLLPPKGKSKFKFEIYWFDDKDNQGDPTFKLFSSKQTAEKWREKHSKDEDKFNMSSIEKIELEESLKEASKGRIETYKGYGIHDVGDSFVITDRHGTTVKETKLGLPVIRVMIDEMIKDLKEAKISEDELETEENLVTPEIEINAFSSLLTNSISREWDSIENLKSDVVTIISNKPELAPAVTDIINVIIDEKIMHVGMLQKALELISEEQMDLVKAGEEKAEIIDSEPAKDLNKEEEKVE